MLTRAPARKSVNLSLNKELLAEAKELGINMSRIAEESIAQAVSAEKSRRWKEENREAIESSNAYVEKHGLPLAKYRMF
ncbi:MAG: type II toxin-antitoxin system CcdA family antitoxin [Rhizobiaceae bacterium]|jgi:antitoxin CcdA|nr:type II toxin-antitoxin system CcdA family antitoxin [Rhizobiaceae bacterium]MBO6724177.1 type II toxin-antitoxin system CcdA family antitoxin [Rhizobiaceae bacterium]